MAKKDYYDILGVNKSSSKDEIKKAYRTTAFKYHPDKNPGDKKAEDKFKEASEAYGVLSDDQKKSNYDQFGHAAFQGGNQGGGGFDSSSFSDLTPFDYTSGICSWSSGASSYSNPSTGFCCSISISSCSYDLALGVSLAYFKTLSSGKSI